jgi:hypothetical protein
MANLLQRIDSQLAEHDTMRLYEEALSHERDVTKKVVSPESVSIVILKNRVGGYGVGIFDVAVMEGLLPKNQVSFTRGVDHVQSEIILSPSSPAI